MAHKAPKTSQNSLQARSPFKKDLSQCGDVEKNPGPVDLLLDE